MMGTSRTPEHLLRRTLAIAIILALPVPAWAQEPVDAALAPVEPPVEAPPPGVSGNEATGPSTPSSANAETAADVEVGSKRRIGLGAAAGYPPSVSVKLLFDARNGIAFHVGPTLATTGLHLRLQFEQAVAELESWSFGDLWFTWHAGAVLSFVFGSQTQGRPVRFGVTGGAGVELRFVAVPASVFAEAAPVIYPVDLATTNSNFMPVGLTVALGGRWYF